MTRLLSPLLLSLLAAALWAAAWTGAWAADVGGYMDQRAREAQKSKPVDDCAELIALAARTAPEAENAATLYYASGMCYLGTETTTRDPAAARTWFQRAAELEHPLAKRALLQLREQPDLLHPPGYHCHDLGMGRRLCHGGPVLQ